MAVYPARPTARSAMEKRTLHFVLYLPDRKTAIYRRTADIEHAALTIRNIPANVSDRVVEVAVNLASIRMEFGAQRSVEYAEFVKRRFVTANR